MAACHNMHHSSRVMKDYILSDSTSVSTAYIGLFPHFLTTSPGRAIVVAQRLISAGLTILELSVVLKFHRCPEIRNCPEILLIWSECPEIDLCYAVVTALPLFCTLLI